MVGVEVGWEKGYLSTYGIRNLREVSKFLKVDNMYYKMYSELYPLLGRVYN